MGDGYMCGRNVKMKESLSHFCGISFLPKWDFFFCGLQIKKKKNHPNTNYVSWWVKNACVCIRI